MRLAQERRIMDELVKVLPPDSSYTNAIVAIESGAWVVVIPGDKNTVKQSEFVALVAMDRVNRHPTPSHMKDDYVEALVERVAVLFQEKLEGVKVFGQDLAEVTTNKFEEFDDLGILLRLKIEIPEGLISFECERIFEKLCQ